MPDRDWSLLPDEPVPTFDDYLAAGGGTGLQTALERGPDEVIDIVTRSGLRGRGGAGFPTGRKWASIREAAAGGTAFTVCNGAEGEPGTFKDRLLMSRNPYQLLEGILIAKHAVGSARAYLATKARFTHERERLEQAHAEMRKAGWLGDGDLELVWGPDEYLFGEESALLEVVEGKLPLPRILPPYMQGLFASMHSPNPTAVNNVETLSNVPWILAHGVDWFRTRGTEESPGTMIFTVVGDVANEGAYELPLGAPLRTLLEDIAGARDIKAIYSGTSNAVITPDLLDLPMDFDSFREAGTGLGSGGFMVYDTSRDIVQVCSVLSRFLAIESCGQCIACKLGNLDIFDRLDRLVRGEGTALDVEELRKRCAGVTDGNRCYLPVGTALTVASTLETFEDEFLAHVGVPTDPAVAVDVPKIVDIDEASGTVRYDREYHRKRSDWSYADE